MSRTLSREWLLIFYSVPSHPVSNRMKLWRKLAKAGAVKLKGAVYVLPSTAEHEEFFQWLIGEVKSMGGDGAFVRSAEIKTMEGTEITGLFVRQSEKEYGGLEKKINSLERKVHSMRRGTKVQETANLGDQLSKIEKEVEEVVRRDFFSSASGAAMKVRIQALKTGLKGSGRKPEDETVAIRLCKRADYQNRIWATRKGPFVDRMASAWLIRHSIDPTAAFQFISESDLASIGGKVVTFDMRGADFTHVGDLCTFEVIIKSFGIRDKAIRKIAEIVHDLDVKDDKYVSPDAAGVEMVLSGIRKTAKDDRDALERGMAVFEMMYQSNR